MKDVQAVLSEVNIKRVVMRAVINLRARGVEAAISTAELGVGNTGSKS